MGGICTGKSNLEKEILVLNDDNRLYCERKVLELIGLPMTQI